MHLKPCFSPRAIAALTILATVALFTPGAITAQEEAPPEKPEAPKTWEDLGLIGVPEEFSTDEISLIDALNKSRGSWSFKGAVVEGDTSSPIEGRMIIKDSFKNAFVLGYDLRLEWPTEEPKNSIGYTIAPIFEPTGFKFMLGRGVKPEPGARPQRREIFLGEWNLESRMILWKQTDPFGMSAASNLGQEQQSEGNETPNPVKSFEMHLAVNGEITIQNTRNTAQRRQITGKTVARIGEPHVRKELGTKELPNGYSVFYANYFHASRSQVCLMDQEMHVEAGARVAKLGTESDYIYGLVEKHRDGNEGAEKPGYFLIDSSDGDKQLGLTLEAFRTALNDVGIDEPEMFKVQLFGPTYFGCEAPPNRKQNQFSPSGKYVLSAPRNYQSKTKESVWMVTIRSKEGSLLYQDKDSTMFGGLNVYFGWDKQDRVWLYNSDDGGIWRWELADGSWQKFGSNREDGMPDWILPEYERSKR